MHEVLQRARDSRNLTNAQLARLLFVSESYISKIMSGARRGNRSFMPKLCRALGVPPPVQDAPSNESQKSKNRTRGKKK
jgi:transcriptional regulator with XRE-family HTH domain